MKTKKFLALASLACALFSTTAQAAVFDPPAAAASNAPDEASAVPPLTVAVLPFDSSDEKLKPKAEEASTLLWAQLSAKPELWLVERDEVDKLLSEHALSLSGLTDPSMAVKAGNLLGAKVLITGRLIHTGDTYVLVAKIMSTETSRVFGATAETCSLDTLAKLAADLADAVAATLGKQAAVFTPAEETPDARLARLRKFTDGKKLPSIEVKIGEQDATSGEVGFPRRGGSIEVKIGEQDATRPVAFDPAAQTEMEKTLSDLGFEIIDPTKSGKMADIVIVGQGLTQAGARNGHLVSARGRVEVQVTRQADGKVLAVDRETSVAVDTAPAIAGKTALQNAAQALVERLVPKLVQP